MLKEAIEKIVSLARPEVITVNGKTFSNQDFAEIKVTKHYPQELKLSSLDSVVQMVRKEAVMLCSSELRSVLMEETGVDTPRFAADELKVYGEQMIFVSVEEYNRVRVFSSYDEWMQRERYYMAQADVPGFREGWQYAEDMIIKLRSLFLQTEDVDYLLNLISHMDSKESVSSSDNGITQTVETKKGVSLKETVQVRPRVRLTPFRTFLEVEQPESEFLLRVKEGQIGLFEADGGVWKMVAKKRVKEWLENQLQDLIEDGRVIVME